MSTPPWHKQPRFPCGHWPTPLEPLERLSAELGGPRIWVKRDDCTGLAVGGNKTRKLEFLIGDALAMKADTVVTFGAVQSNHARQTAAACARAGLACHQVLTRAVAGDNAGYEHNGNVLLGNLLGAHQHIIDVNETRSFTSELLGNLRKAGHTPYVIPAGGSNATGALGYAHCVEELRQQCSEAGIEMSYIMHASSSAGTQAGLLYGIQLQGLNTQVLGVNVYHEDPTRLEARINELLQDMHDTFVTSPKSDAAIAVNHAYYGEGYGIPTAECLAAIRMAASSEGLLFDPVYSGKSLAAMIDQATLGNLRDHDDVILIHTGGSPALYVYDQEFDA